MTPAELKAARAALRQVVGVDIDLRVEATHDA